MEVTKSVDIRLDDRRVIPPIYAVQGETGRQVKISLLTAEGQWVIPANASALVRFRKPDGTCGVYNALPDGSKAYSITGNTLTIQLAPQMLTVAGKTMVQVSIVSDGTSVSTFAMSLCVQADVSAEVVLSEDYVNLIPLVEECDVTFTCPNSFGATGGICYTKVGSDGKITSNCEPVPLISPSTCGGTFKCVKGSTFTAHKGNMPATVVTASVTGAITAIKNESTTGYTIMVFRVDGDGTITLA